MKGKSKLKKYLPVFLIVICFVLLIAVKNSFAVGLVDDTVSSANEYSRFPLLNYQLDFYVDTSWDWLPWNWLEGFGKNVMYALYAVTNMLWTLMLFISSFVSMAVEQAFRMDFISNTVDVIGKNIQILTGVTPQGFNNIGFFVSSLLLIVFILGVYVIYTGLVKKQTTKAFQSIVSFLLIGALSVSFFAFAPFYIKNVNDFSKDLSTSALSLGAKVILPNVNTEDKDSVSLIRDSVFSLMVKQPWLLLQFGTTDDGAIGQDRILGLVEKSPSENRGKDREEAVKKEIEERANNNLTLPSVLNRLAMVLLLALFNLIIGFFLVCLCGIMIFTQILFILFSIFLPLSLIIALIPGQQNVAKRSLMKLFNLIINRAGISLVISITFCVSTMLYSLTSSFPFVFVLFIQALLFIGVYFKLNEILGAFNLQTNDAKQMTGQMRRGYSKLRHAVHFMQMRSMTSMLRGKKASDYKPNESTSSANQPRNKSGKAVGERENVNNTFTGQSNKKSYGSAMRDTVNNISSNSSQNSANVNNKSSGIGQKAGMAVGAVLNTKNRLRDNAVAARENIKSVPTQAAYAARSTKDKVKSGVKDFKRGITQGREKRQATRTEKLEQRRRNVSIKRIEMQNKLGKVPVNKIKVLPNGNKYAIPNMKQSSKRPAMYIESVNAQQAVSRKAASAKPQNNVKAQQSSSYKNNRQSKRNINLRDNLTQKNTRKNVRTPRKGKK